MTKSFKEFLVEANAKNLTVLPFNVLNIRNPEVKAPESIKIKASSLYGAFGEARKDNKKQLKEIHYRRVNLRNPKVTSGEVLSTKP